MTRRLLDRDEETIRRDLAPVRGIMIGLLLCVPFWIAVVVVVGTVH